METADAIEGLLRGLANDFGFGGIGADGGAAQGGERLAGRDVRAVIHKEALDHAGDAEREYGFALVGEKTAGAQNTGLPGLRDAVDFHFDRRDRLGFCGFRLGAAGRAGRRHQGRKPRRRPHSRPRNHTHHSRFVRQCLFYILRCQ